MEDRIPTVRLPGFSIVYVDDDTAARKHVRDNVATRVNHPFLYIDSGEELLRRLDAHELDPLPGMLLIALSLPGMRGAELIKVIRTNYKYLDESPAIAVTSQDRRDPAKDAATEAGADIWIGQPITHMAIDAALFDLKRGQFLMEWVDRRQVAPPFNP